MATLLGHQIDGSVSYIQLFSGEVTTKVGNAQGLLEFN